MHRILNIAGNDNNKDNLIQQPKGDCIFITSVKADIKILSDLIQDEKYDYLANNIRAIHISFLSTPSQIDYYFEKTLKYSKIIVLRLFGDRGTWSYGIEKLNTLHIKSGKTIIILSGTEDEDYSLNELSTINLKESIRISKLLRSGGKDNYRKFLIYLDLLLGTKKIPKNLLDNISYPDPYLYDWRDEKGPKIAIISYKSLFLANELDMGQGKKYYQVNS